MKKSLPGIFLGALAGSIDVVPMIMQNLTWDANLSAFTLWMVNGFLISVTEVKLHPVMKGITVSLLVLAPCAILIGWKSPMSLLPIFSSTIILGAALGFSIERMQKRMTRIM